MKYIISLIALSAVSLSTALTLVFMVQIGSPTGLTAVFIGVGLVMELTKTILPVLVMKAHRLGRHTHTLSLGILTALLMAVSFSASIVSVEAGAEGTRKLSSTYIDMTQRIDTLQVEANDIANRITSLPADYLTQRRTLKAEAATINDKITTLTNQRTSMKPNSIIVQYGSAIAIITATIIELITFLFVPLLFVGSAPKEFTPTPTPEVDTPHSPIEIAIREAIISQRIKPSCTGVRGMFTGIGNNRISALLYELGDEGILIRKGKGWMYP